MMRTGWLDKPEEWTRIPREEQSRRGVLKARLDWIIEKGGAGKPYLLKHAPMSEKHRLQKQTHNYRGRGCDCNETPLALLRV
jgi:hypothetical protein